MKLDLHVHLAQLTAELPCVLLATSVQQAHHSRYSALSQNTRMRSELPLAKPVQLVLNAQSRLHSVVNLIYPPKAQTFTVLWASGLEFNAPTANTLCRMRPVNSRIASPVPKDITVRIMLPIEQAKLWSVRQVNSASKVSTTFHHPFTTVPLASTVRWALMPPYPVKWASIVLRQDSLCQLENAMEDTIAILYKRQEQLSAIQFPTV